MNNKETIEWLRENASIAVNTGHEGFGNVIDVAANTIEELTKQAEQLTAERDDKEIISKLRDVAKGIEAYGLGIKWKPSIFNVAADRLTTLSEKVEKYNELIMAVEHKHPGESRFATALRYIQERESQTNPPQEDKS